MDKKYRIGFLTILLLTVLLLCAGYRISYNFAVDRQSASAQEELMKKEESVAAKGEACQNEGYYLKILEGYVAVYYQDKETLYELTDIPAESLPGEVRNQLREGKYLKNEKELYGFLENYSS